MHSNSTLDRSQAEQFRSFFTGLKLNASQAARVAGVKRPVIATWASRHKDQGFPSALSQADVSHETLYDAFDFALWASARQQAKRSLEEMLILAALEASVGPCISQGFEVQEATQALMSLVVCYQQVDPVVGERPSSLLRRCAQKSPYLAQHFQPYLLKLQPLELELLLCLALMIAEYSLDILGHVQQFASLMMGKGRAAQQLSASTCNFLADLSQALTGNLRLQVLPDTHDVVALQFAHALSTALVQGNSLSIRGDQSKTGVDSLLAYLATGEFLAGDSRPTAVFACLPLAKDDNLTSRYQWERVYSLVSQAPADVPIFVLGRAEILGAPIQENPSEESHIRLVRQGSTLALVDLGTNQLVTESGARLMLGIFENNVKSPESRRPEVALLDLLKHGSGTLRAEATLHDILSLMSGRLEDYLAKDISLHQLVQGVYVKCADLAFKGFDDSLLTLQQTQGNQAVAVRQVNESVRAVNMAHYQPLALNWSVRSIADTPLMALKEAKELGLLKRIAGASPQRLAEVAQPAGKDSLGVRVVRPEDLEHAQVHGSLPAEYSMVSTLDLAQLGVASEPAKDGDLLVLEGKNPVVIPVRAEDGKLMIPQSPVFILRLRAPETGHSKIGCRESVQPDTTQTDAQRTPPPTEVFAGLVRASLEEQLKQGATKALWGKGLVSRQVLESLVGTSQAFSFEVLEQELGKVEAHKRFLLEQLQALELLEKETLSGLSAGKISFETLN